MVNPSAVLAPVIPALTSALSSNTEIIHVSLQIKDRKWKIISVEPNTPIERGGVMVPAVELVSNGTSLRFNRATKYEISVFDKNGDYDPAVSFSKKNLEGKRLTLLESDHNGYSKYRFDITERTAENKDKSFEMTLKARPNFTRSAEIHGPTNAVTTSVEGIVGRSNIGKGIGGGVELSVQWTRHIAESVVGNEVKLTHGLGLGVSLNYYTDSLASDPNAPDPIRIPPRPGCGKNPDPCLPPPPGSGGPSSIGRRQYALDDTTLAAAHSIYYGEVVGGYRLTIPGAALLVGVGVGPAIVEQSGENFYDAVLHPKLQLGVPISHSKLGFSASFGVPVVVGQKNDFLVLGGFGVEYFSAALHADPLPAVLPANPFAFRTPNGNVKVAKSANSAQPPANQIKKTKLSPHATPPIQKNNSTSVGSDKCDDILVNDPAPPPPNPLIGDRIRTAPTLLMMRAVSPNAKTRDEVLAVVTKSPGAAIEVYRGAYDALIRFWSQHAAMRLARILKTWVNVDCDDEQYTDDFRMAFLSAVGPDGRQYSAEDPAVMFARNPQLFDRVATRLGEKLNHYAAQLTTDQTGFSKFFKILRDDGIVDFNDPSCVNQAHAILDALRSGDAQKILPQMRIALQRMADTWSILRDLKERLDHARFGFNRNIFTENNPQAASAALDKLLTMFAALAISPDHAHFSARGEVNVGDSHEPDNAVETLLQNAMQEEIGKLKITRWQRAQDLVASAISGASKAGFVGLVTGPEGIALMGAVETAVEIDKAVAKFLTADLQRASVMLGFGDPTAIERTKREAGSDAIAAAFEQLIGGRYGTRVLLKETLVAGVEVTKSATAEFYVRGQPVTLAHMGYVLEEAVWGYTGKAAHRFALHGVARVSGPLYVLKTSDGREKYFRAVVDPKGHILKDGKIAVLQEYRKKQNGDFERVKRIADNSQPEGYRYEPETFRGRIHSAKLQTKTSQVDGKDVTSSKGKDRIKISGPSAAAGTPQKPTSLQNNYEVTPLVQVGPVRNNTLLPLPKNRSGFLGRKFRGIHPNTSAAVGVVLNDDLIPLAERIRPQPGALTLIVHHLVRKDETVGQGPLVSVDDPNGGKRIRMTPTEFANYIATLPEYQALGDHKVIRLISCKAGIADPRIKDPQDETAAFAEQLANALPGKRPLNAVLSASVRANVAANGDIIDGDTGKPLDQVTITAHGFARDFYPSVFPARLNLVSDPQEQTFP